MCVVCANGCGVLRVRSLKWVGGGGGVLAGCVSSIAEVGLLCVRACVVGRGGGLYVCGEYVCVGLFVLMGQCLFEGAWLHVLTFCRVGEWRLRVCA